MLGRVVAVEERLFGSELLVATVGGETSITVEDALDFEEDGGQAQVYVDNEADEIIQYTAIDEDTGVLTLAAPIVGAYPAETELVLYPQVTERVAHIMFSDDVGAAEAVEARVPHWLYDRMEVGIREEGTAEGETVNVEYEGDELVITDVTGQVPRSDGSYIDPTTLPPNPSDGLPPASSPAPSVRGGIRQLFVNWINIANSDPVEYGVHVSTASGFTADGTNLITTVQGEQAVISQLADGNPLAPNTDYYVKIIASDADGVAAASAEAGPVQLDPAGTEDILVGAVTAERLAAIVTLSSLIRTASEGQRVEIDTEGIRLHNAMGDVVVEIPTDENKSPTFKGELIAGGLEVQGMANFRDITTFDQESYTQLMAGVSDPATKPTLTIELEQLVMPALPGTSPVILGIAYTPNGGAGGATPAIYVLSRSVVGGAYSKTITEHNPTTGAVLRTYNVPTNTSDSATATGLAISGGNIYYIARNQTAGGVQQALIVRVPLSTFSTSNLSVDHLALYFNYACIGNDASGNIVWVTRAGAAGTQYRIYSFDPTTLANTGNATLTGGTGIGSTSQPVGFYHDSGGTAWWIATRFASGTTDFVTAYNSSTSAHIANRDWRTWPQGINKMGGMAWDSTRGVFITVPVYNTNNYVITIHTPWDWTTEDDLYWVGYTWYSTTGPRQTLVSPLQSIDLTGYRRARLKVSHPDMPMIGGIDEHRHYVVRDNTPPVVAADLKHQGVPNYASSHTDMPTFLKNYDPSGAAPPVANTFPSATGAVAQAEAPTADQGWILRGDGLMSLPHFDSAALPDPTTWTGGMVFVTEFGTPAYSDGTQWILDSDLYSGSQVQASFTESTVYPFPSSESQVSRVTAIDGKAMWDAGWRPQARWTAIYDNATAGNNARAGVGYYNYDVDEASVGSLVQDVGALNSGTTTSFAAKVVDWTPFTVAPSKAVMHFVFMIGPTSAGTCTYRSVWFEIRWVKPA